VMRSTNIAKQMPRFERMQRATRERDRMCLSNRKRWSSMESSQYRLESDPSPTSMPKALVDFKAYWDRKRGERSMPARADIDPLDLREHLGWILITELVGETRRLRYRLVGSEIAKRLGRDSTNKYLDELYPAPDHDGVASSFHQVVTSRRPMRMTGEILLSRRTWLTFEVLNLPLSQNGVDVNMIVTRTIIDSRRAKWSGMPDQRRA
jgi:hypothetical protein